MKRSRPDRKPRASRVAMTAAGSGAPAQPGLFAAYDTGGFYDEMFSTPDRVRPHYCRLSARMTGMSPAEFEERRQLADLSFLLQGITFTVYGEESRMERLFPFDLVPRIVPHSEWERIERGMSQRVIALNLFLRDVYGARHILRDGKIPHSLVLSCPHFRRQMAGVEVPLGIHIHIAGIDLVRDSKTGEFLVLEDNLRTPSGISYVLENRLVMKRVFPSIFQDYEVLPVDHYAFELARILRSLAPHKANPTVVLLTPGIHNSAYFEHSFLAKQMGIELVEGRDLVVDCGRVYMKTIRGLAEVDVIYRRVDDDYLDPLEFRSDSALGISGLMGAYRAGNVALANAVGNGVADDKAIYAYVPEFIRYYLGEDPILRNVETYLCHRRQELTHVLEHLSEMVIKPVGESGGYGILIGPEADRSTIEAFRARLSAHPRSYIAQPVIGLSRVPSFDPVNKRFAGRHVDLRPYCLFDGQKVTIVPGGLTRVALKEGGLIVNSSQGGGSKDTWVLRGES